MPFQRIIIDGLDGAGKSTLVATLKSRGYDVQDRGNATQMTDDESAAAEPDAFYIILLASPLICRIRLAAAGKSLDERYHTLEGLVHYYRRYLDIAPRLPHKCYVYSTGTTAATLDTVLFILNEQGILPQPA